MDPSQGGTLPSQNYQQPTQMIVTHSSKEISDLTDEQKRMIEENRLKA
jgi:hypothetical protein